VVVKKNVIYTARDKKYGGFLIDHWYKSLTQNVDLTDIDVKVLDYGLSTSQKTYLENNNVSVVPCERTGHVTVVRFHDLAKDLVKTDYQQVLLCDSGDIIFQTDISEVFTQSPNCYRAAVEDVTSGFEILVNETFFTKQSVKLISKALMGKPQINAGFLLAPRELFLQICYEIEKLVLDKTKFGPDQIVANYILHTLGFVQLDKKYNFVLATANTKFKIMSGKFYELYSNSLIPVVHNAGNWKCFRPIDDFGYGEDKNRLKPEVLRTLRFLHRSSDFMQTTRNRVTLITTQALARAQKRVKNSLGVL
jgi:lipopolysaccharide biosynthesis glycosyltransferase